MDAQLPNTSAEKLLHGSIFTADGQPSVNTLVEVRDLRGIRVGSGVTNSAGGFEIKGAARPGEYIFVVARAFQVKDERVELNRADLELSMALPRETENITPAPTTYAVSAKSLGISAKARTHLAAAQREFARSNLGGASAEVDRALQVDPECAQAFSMRALIKLAQKDAGGALEDARTAASLDSSDEIAFLAMSTAFNSMNDFEGAEKAAKHLLGINPDSWQGRLELAKSLYGRDQFVLAIRELDLLGRDFPDVHLVRGNVLMQLGRRTEGINEFRVFLKEAPKDQRWETIQRIVDDFPAS